MMHMTFYWTKEVTLLFATWRTSSYLSYSLSLLACLLFSSFYQYLENLRLRLRRKLSSAVEQPLVRPNPKKSVSAKVALAILFGINSAIGYLLMLAVMSFNGGVFLAVVLGLIVGYFLFRSEEEGSVHVENPCACA